MDQPRVLRFPRPNLSDSSKPAPNPIAPRVAAKSAISGIVKLLVFDIFLLTFRLMCLVRKHHPQISQIFLCNLWTVLEVNDPYYGPVSAVVIHRPRRFRASSHVSV